MHKIALSTTILQKKTDLGEKNFKTNFFFHFVKNGEKPVKKISEQIEKRTSFSTLNQQENKTYNSLIGIFSGMVSYVRVISSRLWIFSFSLIWFIFSKFYCYMENFLLPPGKITPDV